jgi:hypothetical protein
VRGPVELDLGIAMNRTVTVGTSQTRAIRALRLNRLKNFKDDVGFRKPRSSFRCRADEAG